MSKVAKLVLVSFMTRIVVDETATDEQILDLARPKFLEKVIHELHENLEEIKDDTEMPYDEAVELTEKEILILEKKQRKFVEYKGVKYPTRIFNVIVEGELEQYTISVESLSEAMGDDKEKHDTEANNIDNQIYFYVEDEIIDLTGEDICENHLDVPMVFVEEVF